MKNVIILTHGFSGSSVLSAFISKAGFWLGNKTFKNKDYDTYENIEIVNLNKLLIKNSGININTAKEFSRNLINIIEKSNPDRAFRIFAKKLNKRKPWLLKDPRFYVTIRFWKNLIDFKNVKFILLTRQPLQMWISNMLRRWVQSFDYNQRFDFEVIKSYQDFLETSNLDYIKITFESFIINPDSIIEKINNHLGTSLSINDLKDVYKDRLYIKRHGIADFLTAIAIYVKNYPSRYEHFRIY